MEHVLIIICSLLMILLGNLVLYICIEKQKSHSHIIKQDLQEQEIEEWRSRMLGKIKEHIAISSEAERRVMAGEDAIAKFIYNRKEIKKLHDDLVQIFDEQIAMLLSLHPTLTELDIVVIILLGIGMDNYEIAILLGMEKRTLYRRRQLIAKRIKISSTQIESLAKKILAT